MEMDIPFKERVYAKHGGKGEVLKSSVCPKLHEK